MYYVYYERKLMEHISAFMDYFIMLENMMDQFLVSNGNWAYLFLFVLFFSETGIIFTSFLPGDSMLMAIGVLCADGKLKTPIVIIVLMTAVVLGNLASYYFGWVIGKSAYKRKGRILNPANLQKTHDFYDKYGAITLVMSRFFPIIRALAPLIAGIVRMPLRGFMIHSFIGSIIWIIGLLLVGMFFGKITFIRENTLLAVTIIMLITAVIFPLILVGVNSIRNRIRGIKNSGKALNSSNMK